MSDPLGAAAKAARSNVRSRAACSACRQTKQKCDGPSRVPCRRCELYNLQCEYPPSSGPAPKPARASASESFVPPPPFSIGAGDLGVSAAMSERLREISERLKSIESSLEHVHISGPNSGDSPLSFPHRSSDAESSSNHSHHNDSGHLLGVGSGPVSTVNETVEMVETITKEKESKSPEEQGFTFDWLNGGSNMTSGVSRTFAGMPKADAIVRGIMSQEECDATFQIFFAKLSPWCMIFDQQRDSNASAMRERNSLLFHSILLCTSYYLMGTSERGAQVYYSLTALVNELLAPHIVSAQPHQVTTDFIRALMLLLIYKPVQFASLHADGITDPDQAEQVSKLNTHSASVLGGLINRTAFSISLPSITNTFAKTFSPNVEMAPQVLADLRLWYWVCVVDTHSALTTGRAGMVDIQECLRTTRLFASLKAQQWDVRLAATVELYATAKFAAVGSHKADTLTSAEIRKFNKELDDHNEYWLEPLKDAGRQDGLAYSVLSIFATFLRLVVNSSVFTRWRSDRRQSLARGDTGRPDLNSEDWALIQLGIKAAEQLVFSLSMESRSDGIIRQVKWPQKAEGSPRGPLTLDPIAVDTHRTAFDTIVCVVYVFSMILLAKLANAGLIRCELQCLEDEYNAGISLDRPRRLVHGAKLGRLLELGASFLEAVAPTASHPCKKHAKMIRTILAAGTLGQLTAVDPDGLIAQQDVRVHSSSSSSSGSSHPLDSALPPPPQFSLPQVNNYSPNKAPVLSDLARGAGLASPEAGEALASILGGIQPNFFGNVSFFDGMDMGGNLDGTFAVDWDKLEQSLQMQVQNQSGLSPGLQLAGGITSGGMDYFSHPISSS